MEDNHEERRRTFTAWALRYYAEATKTKTVSMAKYERIIKTLRGQIRNSAENSKFRFWMRSKGFWLGWTKTESGEEKEILFVGNGGSVRRVAVVEEFFDIICWVHVGTGARTGFHSGQKRTYRTISESYAFLPREAVTKFLLGCQECQRRAEASDAAPFPATPEPGAFRKWTTPKAALPDRQEDEEEPEESPPDKKSRTEVKAEDDDEEEAQKENVPRVVSPPRYMPVDLATSGGCLVRISVPAPTAALPGQPPLEVVPDLDASRARLQQHARKRKRPPRKILMPTTSTPSKAGSGTSWESVAEAASAPSECCRAPTPESSLTPITSSSSSISPISDTEEELSPALIRMPIRLPKVEVSPRTLRRAGGEFALRPVDPNGVAIFWTWSLETRLQEDEPLDLSVAHPISIPKGT